MVRTELLCFPLVLFGCRNLPPSAPGQDAAVVDDSGLALIFEDVTEARLPAGVAQVLTTDLNQADLDGDGDLDLLIAWEHGANLLLINDGEARFTEASERLPRTTRDTEEVVFGDLDGDGDLDALLVSEDDQQNELYLNEGGSFQREDDRLPVTGTSNAVVLTDLNDDGRLDAIIGNNGQNNLLMGDGAGGFIDETSARLPQTAAITQDLALADIDGDGDLDLVTGNEDDNRIYINDGAGVFADESAARLPLRAGAEETRGVDLADIDGDGDLDLLFANVGLGVGRADPQNRVLINNGAGVFVDETESRLPTDKDYSMDGDFADIDGDGDPDILTANYGDSDRPRQATRYRVYLNDGAGVFVERTGDLLPETAIGHGFDIEAADYNGDGVMDLYLGSGRSADRLLLGARR